MNSLPPPLPRKHRRRKTLIIVAVGLLLPILVLGTLYHVVMADEPPSTIDDFHMPTRVVADADNAYLILRDAALALAALPALPNGEAPPKLATVINGEATLSSEEIDHLLAPYAALWATLDAADLAQDSRPPVLNNILDTIPETENLRLVVDLSLLRALRDARRGDTPAALARACQALRLSRKIEASRNTLLQLILGHALVSSSLASIREISDHTTDPALLKSTANEISSKRSEIEFTVAALRNEARVVAHLLGSTDELKSLVELDTDNTTLRARFLARLLYKPNQTQRIYATFMRDCIALPHQPWTVINQKRPRQELEKFTSAPLPESLLNKGGRKVLTIVAITPTAIIGQRLQTEAHLDLTRVYLALRAYYMENQGRLPTTLATLVPSYLAELPLDPFDGAPLRYSPEFQAIWSVGRHSEAVTSADDPLPAKLPASRLNFARTTPPAVTEFGPESSPISAAVPSKGGAR